MNVHNFVETVFSFLRPFIQNSFHVITLMQIANTFMLLTYFKNLADKIDFVVCVVKGHKIQFRNNFELIVRIQKCILKVNVKIFNLDIKILPISKAFSELVANKIKCFVKS